MWSWQEVEDRLVEAMRCWWRSPDGDRRYAIGGRISSVWQHYAPSRRDLASWDMLTELKASEPRALPLSRADMARMVEASEWLRFVPEADRRLVVLVLGVLASGEKRVPWLKLRAPMGVSHGADGLRKRYSRALTTVARALEAGSTQRVASSGGASGGAEG